MGSICSILLFFILGSYTYQKFEILIAKKDVDILMATNDWRYNSDFVFDYKKGFSLALGLSSYDSTREPEFDESYGKIVFNHYRWGPLVAADGGYGSERVEIPSH